MRTTFCDIKRPLCDRFDNRVRPSQRAKSEGRQRKVINPPASWKQHAALAPYKSSERTSLPVPWDEVQEAILTPKSNRRPASALATQPRAQPVNRKHAEAAPNRPRSALDAKPQHRVRSKNAWSDERVPRTGCKETLITTWSSCLHPPVVQQEEEERRRKASWQGPPCWRLNTEMDMQPVSKSGKVSCQLRVSSALSNYGPPAVVSLREKFLFRAKSPDSPRGRQNPEFLEFKETQSTLHSMAQTRAKNLLIASERMPGIRPLAEFYLWCIHKFGNLTRTWRMLDLDQNMRLTYFEFLKQLKTFEYSGDARIIFRILDRDRSGSLSYYHFDPKGAIDLAMLVHFCRATFGSLRETHKALDIDRNDKLTKKEFTDGVLQAGLYQIDAVDCLFEMLDLDKDRKVKIDELRFLDIWKPLPFLQAQADPVGAEKVKRRLFQKYGNPIIAWYKALDTNHAMRVSWTEFENMAEQELEEMEEKELAGIWKGFDSNMSGWLSMNNFDLPSYEVLAKFKRYCENKAGSIVKAFPCLDENEDGMISRREFFGTISKELHLEHEQAELLFGGLDLDGTRKIKLQDLRYLDRWNLDEDINDEQCWEMIISSFRQETKKQAPGEISVPSSQESSPKSRRATSGE